MSRRSTPSHSTTRWTLASHIAHTLTLALSCHTHHSSRNSSYRQVSQASNNNADHVFAPTHVRETPAPIKFDGEVDVDPTPIVYGKVVPKGYAYLIDPQSGKIIMTLEGKKIMNCMRQLCWQVFRNALIVEWKLLDKASKEYILRTLHEEFPVPSTSNKLNDDWMKVCMQEYMKHQRSNAHKATSRLNWLDREEWKRIKAETKSTPNKWQQ